LLDALELEPLLDEMPDELDELDESEPLEVDVPLESLPVLVVVFVVVPVELVPVEAPASVTPTISPMVRATAPAAMPAPAYPARIRTLGWGRLAPGVFIAITLLPGALRGSQRTIKPVLSPDGNRLGPPRTDP
jgi:hypothetical protein